MGVISFKKIFGLCGVKGHIVEIRSDVTFVHDGMTECEDRARILKQNSQYYLEETFAHFPRNHSNFEENRKLCLLCLHFTLRKHVFALKRLMDMYLACVVPAKQTVDKSNRDADAQVHTSFPCGCTVT